MKAASLPFAAEATRSVSPPAATAARDGAAWPVTLLGVTFEHASTRTAADRIATLVATHARRRVELVTAARLFRARHDADLRHALLDADLVLCESAALVIASRWLGNALPGRVPAETLTRELARRAVEHDWRVFVVGDAVAGIGPLLESLRGVRLAGTYTPPAGGAFDAAAATQAIAGAPSDLVLLRSTTGELEPWLAGPGAAIAAVCVHLAADRRACRAGESPRLTPGIVPPLRQRLADAVTIAREVWRHQRRRARRARGAASLACTRDTEGWVDVDAGEHLTRTALDRQPAAWRTDPLVAVHCTVDVSRIREIDATGLALLSRYRAVCRRAGRHLVLVAPSAAVRAALCAARLLDAFEIASSVGEARRRAPRRPAGAITGLTRSLAWCGEIIAANVDDVWQMTSDYIRSFVGQGATLVIIDLGRLRFIDSAGATLMVRVKRWARELHAEILFTHPQAHVAGVLQVTAAENFVLEGAQ